MDPDQLFEADYFAARDAFRRDAEAAGAQLEALEVCNSTEGEPLTCDVAVLGEPGPTLVLSSGIHGVEGFAGSAVQRLALSQPPDGVRLVLLHALNPFGMCEGRRFNENNVDLNRNFLASDERYEGAGDGYRMLHPLINPQRPYAGPDGFLFKALLKIVRHGFAAMKQATTEGQYEYEKGLFFGGKQLEHGPQLLLDALTRHLEGCDPIVHIDLHTGLGKRGVATVLVDCPPDSPQMARYHEVLGPNVSPWQADAGVAYAVTGDFGKGVARVVGDRRLHFFTVEMGTNPPLKVIAALRAENQATHWGGDLESARAMLLEAFRPDDPAWRQAVVARGRSLLAKVPALLQQPAEAGT